MEVVVDINGRKGPNVLGIDGFVFYYSPDNNRLVPRGLENVWNKEYKWTRDNLLGKNWKDGYVCSRESGGHYYQGSYCAAVIILDGWQILDDYPWGNSGR